MPLCRRSFLTNFQQAQIKRLPPLIESKPVFSYCCAFPDTTAMRLSCRLRITDSPCARTIKTSQMNSEIVMPSSPASRSRISSVSSGILVCRGITFFPMTQLLPDRENEGARDISALTWPTRWPAWRDLMPVPVAILQAATRNELRRRQNRLQTRPRSRLPSPSTDRDDHQRRRTNNSPMFLISSACGYGERTFPVLRVPAFSGMWLNASAEFITMINCIARDIPLCSLPLSAMHVYHRAQRRLNAAHG